MLLFQFTALILLSLIISMFLIVMRCCFALVSDYSTMNYFNSFPTSGDFYRLLITFANSLGPDQA